MFEEADEPGKVLKQLRRNRLSGQDALGNGVGDRGLQSIGGVAIVDLARGPLVKVVYPGLECAPLT
jgi:hypothetical protein